MERAKVWSRWAAAAWVFFFVFAGEAAAQRRAGARFNVRTAADDDLALDGVFLPPDRSAKRRLETAQEMLEERRYGEAVRLLGALLENPEDFFFKPNGDKPVYRSLKAEAGRLLADLPAEGRESYELQFGARARAMLKQAAASGNLAEMAEVSRRFLYTSAGQEATFILGRNHLDQNRPLAAALCLERLRETPATSQRLEPMLSLTLATCWLRAAQPDKAKEVLVRFKRDQGQARLKLAGKSVKLFALDTQALAWFESTFGSQRPVGPTQVDSWAVYRGDERRNAASHGGRPLLSVRWRQRTTDDRAVEKFVSKSRNDYISQEIVAIPAMHPLAVGDVVVMRTAFALQAVDFNNGKLIWKYPATDDSFEHVLRSGSQQPASGMQQLLAGLDQRVWEDTIYGMLSSDGAQVYFVEDLGLAGVSSTAPTTVLPNGQRRLAMNSRASNCLAARELRTQGKLRWQVGGMTGEDEPKLAGAFFLGPPLPLLGRLYALAEFRGQEIRLVALSPKTGELEWSQQLAVVEAPVGNDGFRRNAGATPSFADGVLVCPTSAGAVVGMDLTTRSLLWGYQYPRVQQYAGDRFVNARLAIYPGTERRSNERWTDATVTIAEGRVLVTPVETDQLYCLSLSDGKELWKRDRAGTVYVACIHDGRAILVGRNSVSAVTMEDGKKAWTADLELPPHSLPSGRGFYSGDHYYLPLTSGEVAKIDLRAGKIVEQSKSRSGAIPGNLVAYRGSVLSQGPDSVEAYHQLDALKDQIAVALAKQPEDAQALAELGEVKLDEGLLGEAVDLFRRSYKLKSDESTRDNLVESLLASLRQDFKANAGSLAELESLLGQPRHRVEFLRLKAVGLQSAGEVVPAFETYLQLLEFEPPWTIDSIDPRLSVRRDRWIRSQFGQLRAVATSEQRARIDELVMPRLESALSGQNGDTLRAFLNVFGDEPPSARARAALVARLSDEVLECNLLLRPWERSSDSAQAGAAAALMAKLLADAHRPELAAIYYRHLGSRFATVACRDGKTGSQLVAELAEGDPVRKALNADPNWPTAHVTAQDDKTPARGGASNARIQRPVDLEIVGPRGPLFEDVTISYDATQNLVALDGFGERRFRIPMFEQGGRRLTVLNRNAYNAPALSYLSVNGGLAVLSLGTQVAAVDTLRSGDPAANRVLWIHDLNDQIGGYPTNQGVLPRPINLPWGGVRQVPEDTFGRRLGSIGPVNDEGVCFQRLHDLHCVEPLSGKTIWIRKNVGLGNDLFGDEELLFVAPAGDGETLVLRAGTGEQLGTRRVAPFDRRMATLGRRVLSWESNNVMQMRDLWADKTLWSFDFATGSKAALVSQDAVGVMQPDGIFTLVSLADGKQLAREQLEPEAQLLGIYLLRSQFGYVLATNTQSRNEPNVSIQPLPVSPSSPPISGRLYAFDRESGKKLWPAPVEVSQYGLLLTQPCNLPGLVLARQVHRLNPTTAREPKISVMCIDKRSGRIVYQNEQLPGTTIGNMEVIGDLAAHTMTITLPTRVIQLAFSDQPPPQKAAVAPQLSPGLVLDPAALQKLGVPDPAQEQAVELINLEGDDDPFK